MECPISLPDEPTKTLAMHAGVPTCPGKLSVSEVSASCWITVMFIKVILNGCFLFVPVVCFNKIRTDV